MTSTEQGPDQVFADRLMQAYRAADSSELARVETRGRSKDPDADVDTRFAERLMQQGNRKSQEREDR